ncbi:MAG: two-component sensor histidine kinase, partial [Bacteroidaceae bacterium]|nr:two-component sensor histidine kinase [Bacteroidaceae bacterium]
NLVSNAIKYNKEGGSITVSISETGQGVCLQVKDTGIGIEKEHLPRLCERFYRVDKSHSKRIGGTGLGLAIVKHICAISDAEFSIESEFGIGTTVTVVFEK